MSEWRHSISKEIVLGQPRFYGTFEFSGITPEQFEMLLEFERRLSEVKE